MKKQDPKPGQKVWVWSYQYGCPREMTYLSRCGAWRKWRRFEPDFGESREFNLNGLPKWYETDHECAWAQFSFYATSGLSAHWNRERHAEDAFACACEYVRRMSDSFKKPAGEVWDEGRYPIGDALRIAREAVEAGAVDEIYLSRLRKALDVVFPPEHKCEDCGAETLEEGCHDGGKHEQ